jgi:hypothetical protein
MSTTFLSIDKIDQQPDVLEGVKIPSTLKSDSRLKPLNTKSRIVVMSNVNGNQISSEGGIILFNLPSQGYIKPNSMYVRFSVAPISSLGTQPCIFKGVTAGCGQVVGRSTVSFGAQVVDVINSYEKVYSQVLGNFTSKSYLYSTGNISQGCMNDLQTDVIGAAQVVPGTMGNTSMIATQLGTNVYRFSMPILNAVLNGQQAIPAFLINGGIQIQLDLNSASLAVLQACSPSLSLQFSDIQIVYEELMLEHDVMLSIKEEMAQSGKLYELNTTGTIVFKNSMLTTDSQNTFTTNLNLRSVKSLQVCAVNQNESIGGAPPTFTNNGFFLDPAVAGTTSTTLTSSTASLIVDGQAIYQYPLNNSALQSASLKDCGVSLYDTNSTSCANLYSTTTQKYGYVVNTENSWQRRFYSLGYNLRKDNGSDTTFTGTKVCTLQHQFSRVNVSPGGNLNLYYIVNHSKIIAIDSTGSCLIIQ